MIESTSMLIGRGEVIREKIRLEVLSNMTFSELVSDYIYNVYMQEDSDVSQVQE